MTTVEGQNYSYTLPDLWLTFRHRQVRRYSVERLQNRMLVQTDHFLNIKRNINKLSQTAPPRAASFMDRRALQMEVLEHILLKYGIDSYNHESLQQA